MRFDQIEPEMNSSETPNIFVSEFIGEISIANLEDEFVRPFEPISESVSPRRLLGNYLTYVVKEMSDAYSVMLKKVKNQIHPHCNCIFFQSKGKCQHIAIVLKSLERQLANEKLMQQAKTKALDNKKIESNNKVNKSSAITPKLKKATSEKVSDAPFIIQNAKDFSSARLYKIIPNLSNGTRRARIFSKSGVTDHGFKVVVKSNTINESVSYFVNDADEIEIKCSCGQTYLDHICKHALDTIIYLIETGHYLQFSPFTNKDAEKNRLLDEFGLKITDVEAQEFKFSQDYAGRLSLTYVPPQYMSLSKMLDINHSITKNKQVNKIFKSKEASHKIGIYLQLSNANQSNNPCKIEAYRIDIGKKGEEKFTKLLIGKEENKDILSVLEPEKLSILMDFSYLTFKDIIGSSYYAHSYSLFTTQHYDNTRKLYLKYFFSKLEEHWHELSNWENIKILPENENFSKSNLINIHVIDDPVIPKISVTKDDKFIIIKVAFVDGDDMVIIGEDEPKQIFRGKIILSNHQLYQNKADELVNFLSSIPTGILKFPDKYADRVVKEILHPLQVYYGVEIPDELNYKVLELPMTPVIHLSEYLDKFLMIVPKFQYGDLTIENNDNIDYYIEDGESKKLLLRKKDVEMAFIDYIKSMHPHFKQQTFLPHFTLPFDEVMRNSWFLDFSKEMIAEGIKMIGVNELKRFKYNSATPNWNMKVTSGIDWFDVKVTASWDDQVISFKDIRKAIMNKQNFVVLGDGSFGMLPDEWITKYSSLFKFGVDEKDGVKVSKKQFNIVELLFDQIDNEEVIAEIEDKKRKLLHIEDLTTVPVPSEIKAQLRPYQETGYQWMQVLDSISWGGCLADDMGLGKTLQTITFLSYLKNKYNNPTSLIICPTSLIYNWESELNKFAPELKYHIFYGMGRSFSKDHFNDFDIIISSYGIVRNDIESLVKFKWEYVILDESQAIKNPDAISTKAVQLLAARNKFILSGTPLQNNTYDIYAQFNFLNPGLLGGREFFRQEFANPIDKNGDKDASMMLRRLIKPFMLRRTKGEVATDLPEKTETILWCQMDKNQKTLYDEYKDYYRHALMQKIETDGMAKAGVYILEGLLRLRQICDDPRLVKDKDTKPFKGIKIKELVREIQENMGNHKMLVFSQFTEMLSLIREEMDENKIKYCYLDGGTPAASRQDQVELFQNDASINVFLISLKAGGVGLNLTEADYVYIVDPWWNPAVEQQAIDRTHRIGQKNKIFAYKMICKDTVEEKIITLQQKKLSISKEIIQEDTAFFKSLSKDDISFLFS